MLGQIRCVCVRRYCVINDWFRFNVFLTHLDVLALLTWFLSRLWIAFFAPFTIRFMYIIIEVCLCASFSAILLLSVLPRSYVLTVPTENNMFYQFVSPFFSFIFFHNDWPSNWMKIVVNFLLFIQNPKGYLYYFLYIFIATCLRNIFTTIIVIHKTFVFFNIERKSVFFIHTVLPRYFF